MPDGDYKHAYRARQREHTDMRIESPNVKDLTEPSKDEKIPFERPTYPTAPPKGWSPDVAVPGADYVPERKT